MTSNRLQFKVSALREQINRTHAAEIEAAEHERGLTLDHDAALDRWRAAEIKRVRSLASRYAKGSVTDDELGDFSTAAKPSPRRVTIAQNKLETTVREAYEQRDVALRRLDAIRHYTPEGEVDPVIELTPSMARDWFGI